MKPKGEITRSLKYRGNGHEQKVIVLGEFRDGSLRNVTFEAIAAGKTVAEGER